MFVSRPRLVFHQRQKLYRQLGALGRRHRRTSRKCAAQRADFSRYAVQARLAKRIDLIDVFFA
jgi:hypothetical protein